MLSEYRDLLEKRRLERKRGNNPVPTVPPFVVLSKDELAAMPPSSPAPTGFEPRSPSFSTDPFNASQRSPSRQPFTTSPPPARPRNIATPPPIASSIASARENDQHQLGGASMPSYLTHLAPFSVTPRKRMFVETTMITVEESVTKEPHRNKRVQSSSITRERETEHVEYLAQSADVSQIQKPAVVEQAIIPDSVQAKRLNNNNDIDMVDVNVNNNIPDNVQPSESLIENDMSENLSMQDLSIHNESHLEGESHNPSPPATFKSPDASSNSEHHTRISQDPQQQMSRDDVRESNKAQNEAQPGDDAKKSAELPEPAPGDDASTEPAQQAVAEERQENDEAPVESNMDIGESSQVPAVPAVKVIDQTPTKEHGLDTDNQVDSTTQDNQIKHGFDDGDDIDYGGHDDVDYQEEGKPAENVSQVDAMSQAEETPNNVLKDLRTMATANTLNLKKIRKLSNLHIKTISNLVLDCTKEARNNTMDAHEKSIIEDYYYTVNDALKKYHKHYLQYQQCVSANRRLTAYHRKKDLHFLNVIKEEGTLKRSIHDLREEISELDKKLDTLTSIEDMFHDINQIKDVGSTTVTKQV
ncbi:hypothetical protein HMPREF1544_02069 [Mucor circinelloides 1006PhL]|uniref:Uncharacterized protein n=1 Tax=Mucor circinelloides f. circinelloides (strain 1006PhL) TaxID=1220926 RepID=S2KF85_MUCC1|nr:hypothetical protein HMPREF1544_02069 [Mucor circinelloides 1006PhL]